MKARRWFVFAALLAAAFLNGCQSGHGLQCDETFRYMCTSWVGPITCEMTNIVDSVCALSTEGNKSLASNGCPFGISIIYRSKGAENHAKTGSCTLPPCPIHDACMMMAAQSNLSYFYQKGVIHFFGVPEADETTSNHCARCEHGLCDFAEIGPFSFAFKPMEEIVRDVCVVGNRQLRGNGHAGFFVVQLAYEGPIKEGRTVNIEKGPVRIVLSQVARSIGLKVASDCLGCYYFYQNKSDIQDLGRSLVCIAAD